MRNRDQDAIADTLGGRGQVVPELMLGQSTLRLGSLHVYDPGEGQNAIVTLAQAGRLYVGGDRAKDLEKEGLIPKGFRPSVKALSTSCVLSVIGAPVVGKDGLVMPVVDILTLDSGEEANV